MMRPAAAAASGKVTANTTYQREIPPAAGRLEGEEYALPVAGQHVATSTADFDFPTLRAKKRGPKAGRKAALASRRLLGQPLGADPHAFQADCHIVAGASASDLRRQQTNNRRVNDDHDHQQEAAFGIQQQHQNSKPILENSTSAQNKQASLKHFHRAPTSPPPTSSLHFLSPNSNQFDEESSTATSNLQLDEAAPNFHPYKLSAQNPISCNISASNSRQRARANQPLAASSPGQQHQLQQQQQQQPTMIAHKQQPPMLVPTSNQVAARGLPQQQQSHTMQHQPQLQQPAVTPMQHHAPAQMQHTHIEQQQQYYNQQPTDQQATYLDAPPAYHHQPQQQPQHLHEAGRFTMTTPTGPNQIRQQQYAGMEQNQVAQLPQPQQVPPPNSQRAAYHNQSHPSQQHHYQQPPYGGEVVMQQRQMQQQLVGGANYQAVAGDQLSGPIHHQTRPNQAPGPHHNQRLSPYSNNIKQQQQPNLVRVAPGAGVANNHAVARPNTSVGGQQAPIQYKTNSQLVSPLNQPSSAANYTPNSTQLYQANQPSQHQQHPGPQFIMEEQQYPSDSPTLLQQQLNRQQAPPPNNVNVSQQQRRGINYGMPPQPALAPQPIGNNVAKQHQQIRAGRVYEQEQQQAMYVSEQNTRLMPSQRVDQQQYYPAQSASKPIQHGARVRAPMMDQAPPPPPHLLDNPTPPLTPNPASGVRQPLQQAPVTVSHVPVEQRPPLSNQSPQQQYVQQKPPVGYGSPMLAPSPHNKPLSQNHYSPSQPHHHNQPHHLGDGSQAVQMAASHQQRIMPKSVSNSNQPYMATTSGHHQTHNSDVQPPSQSASAQHLQTGPPVPEHTNNGIARGNQALSEVPTGQTRLTLPLRDAPLMGPFRLEHDAQFTSKVFHIKPQLFDQLSKSMNLMSPQTAAVVQELQFRAYTVKQQPMSGDSLLASNNTQQQKSCSWPELFQVSVNQNFVHLDRTKGSNKPVDIFQYCLMGDNVLDIQVNDCYCTHEFVLEAVDRPTLKAFMNSCFKSRLLPVDGCLQKLKFNFGAPGFSAQNQQLHQVAGIVNEYVSEFVQGIEQTRIRVSLKCPITTRRMRTPARGHNCKHLQCFDLENFLLLNRERSQWSCPICSLAIPFNMLELDQHQMNIIQTMSDVLNTDDILVDANGRWLAYYGSQPQHTTLIHNSPINVQSQQTAKSTGTFHPQAPTSIPTSKMVVNGGSPSNQVGHHQPMRPISGPSMNNSSGGRPNSLVAGAGSPSSWDSPYHNPHDVSPLGPVRRPASTLSQSTGSGRRSANSSPLTKKPYAGQYAQSGHPSSQQQASGYLTEGEQAPSDNIDELSPLAAMERTIIQHEQQMGPPPFDPNSLTSSPVSVVRQASGSNSSSMIPSNQQASSSHTQPIQDSRQANSTAYSPASHGVPSPMNRMVPASPQQNVVRCPPVDLPHSPMQQQQQHSNISTPATPSSSMVNHGGPETPATPSNQQQHSVSGIGHSNHAGSSVSSQQMSNGVDHQPLSNGSASVGSIASSSTMTPSGQSLGSVGMGGDNSRCGTAPLQTAGSTGSDELIMSGSAGYNQGGSMHMKQSSLHGHNQHLDDKGEILMDKLLDSSEQVNSGLAIALEDADWKQQLDRGKSEHLANFLNEPLMKKPPFNQQTGPTGTTSKMLSSLSDDDGNHSRGSSPSQNVNDRLEYANYLNCADTVDDGAGLPPDDSILDLFER